LTYEYNDSYPKSDRENLDKVSKFMARRLKELEGFAVLDRTNRYQVIFPKGWQDSSTESREKSPVKSGARSSP
ncbi:MAG: hypothetical protein ACREQW_10245, partial [Candidatus Binatia bacterium]